MLSLLAASCSTDSSPNYMGKNHKTTTKITLDEAQADLQSLLVSVDAENSRSYARVRKISDARTVKAATVKSRSGDEMDVDIHVFNFEDEQGFAIMSADERYPSLIALADSGSLKENTVVTNPGVAMYVDRMSVEYIQRCTDEEVFPIDGSGNGTGDYKYTYEYTDWETIVYKYRGYCPVKWGQEDPYNKYCPVKNGVLTATGCVPTALAQLMACYRFPTSYNGYTFDWDLMTRYWRPYGEEAESQVARLMQQLGLPENLDAEYKYDEKKDKLRTSVNPENIIKTLRNFGFSYYGKRISYRTDDVVSELKNGYPVLSGGYCTKNRHSLLGVQFYVTYDDGHRWLLHGLLERKRYMKIYANGVLTNTQAESEYYVLCNWGWNGICDGYYLSGVFDCGRGLDYDDYTQSRYEYESKSGDEMNFKYRVDAVVGVRK